MSAERLREAAKWMRKRAERAPEGPYGMSSAWTTPYTMLSRVTAGGGKIIAEVRERSEFNGVYTVDYFSTMTPAVALAMADWLEASADHADSTGGKCVCDDAALAVADAYLGTTNA